MHPKIFPPSKKNEFYHTQCPARHLTREAANCNGKKRNCARRTIRRFIHSLNCAKKTKKKPLGEFRQAGYYCHKGNSNPRLQIISLYKTNKSNKSIAGKGGRAAHYRQMPRALSQILLGELSDVSGLQGSGYDIPRKRILDFFVDYTL